ncbi:Thiamine-phosphate synthase [bioreactor metagenome]|uniref:thiamine phosphate synthase n=1 Tax=bioreactor metagenome TaxID=1076179 RepID=A0A644YQQ7_9ZZZZ
MRCDRGTLLLYAVTDRAWTGRQTLYEQVESALKGGVTCVQLREKELDHALFLQEAVALKKQCDNYHIPLIINDDVEIAIQCRADGIHVGQSDRTARDVRAMVGETMILGVSVQTVAQALEAQRAGADYLGVGAVFPTATKQDAGAVTLAALRDICRAVRIPVVAIGGIGEKNLPQLAGSGIAGAALVSAIFGAGDIEITCRRLKALAEQTVRI